MLFLTIYWDSEDQGNPSPSPTGSMEDFSALSEAICESSNHISNPGISAAAPTAQDTSTTPPAHSQQSLFHRIPEEIFLQIVEINLDLDPVAQVCLSVTCRHLYANFRRVIVPKYYKNPVDLRMQIGVSNGKAETCCLYGRGGQGHPLARRIQRAIPRFTWQPSLLELLCTEKTLFANMWYCQWCVRFKPHEAFTGTFYTEVELGPMVGSIQRKESRYMTETSSGELKDCEYFDFDKMCKRCRASHLLVYWDGRQEIKSVRENAFEDRKSLGLIKYGRENRPSGRVNPPRIDGVPDKELWETWEEVFVKMGI